MRNLLYCEQLFLCRLPLMLSTFEGEREMINFQKFDYESAPVYGEGWDVAKHGHFSVIILPSFLLLPFFLDFRSINYFLQPLEFHLVS